MEVNTVIKINEVSKYYDKFLSLDSVSAEIE